MGGISDGPARYHIPNGEHAPLQMVRGDPNDPHRVREGEYKELSDQSVGEHIIVPDVSGCAAVKVNVFSGEGEDKILVSSLVLHSDAKDESIQSAETIAGIITSLDRLKKSVGIFIVTNARWNGMADHARKVLPVITKLLRERNIPVKVTTMELQYVIPQKVDIDVTGSEGDIRERYKKYVPNE